MAYIAPNSDVKIMYGIPWNNTYKDSVWFANATVQFNSITNTCKYTFANQSYQRAGKNSIKLNVLCDNLYDCNYMCFRNTSYGNKWFYAFITNVEYINNDTTLVTYEIDVMQTWMFDYDLLPCFIERQHVSSDNVGEHLIEENLEIGDLVLSVERGPLSYQMQTLAIVFITSFSAYYDAGSSSWVPDLTSRGQKVNQCYSGYSYIVCKNIAGGPTAIELANALVNDSTVWETEDGILSIFMYPEDFIVQDANGNYLLYDSGVSYAKYDKPSPTSGNNTIDGYTPKNNKLYSYPYSQIIVTDGANQIVPLRYEYFKEPNSSLTGKYSFSLKAETSANPTVALIPNYYKSLRAEDAYNAILMGSWPMCAWSTDTFKAYIAQTYGPAFAMSTPERTPAQRAIAGAAQGISSAEKDILGGLRNAVGVGAASPARSKIHMAPTEIGVAGATVNTLDGVFSKISDLSTRFMEPNQAHGTVTDTNGVNFGFKEFHVYEACIKSNYAKIVDDYFSMFGYAIHAVGVPNNHVRLNWTYLKTIGCKIDGYIPFDHENLICQIYDNGITFWTGIPQFGRYDYPNTILT